MPIKDPEARRKYLAEYRKINRERIRERDKAYYLNNKETILAKQKASKEQKK